MTLISLLSMSLQFGLTSIPIHTRCGAQMANLFQGPSVRQAELADYRNQVGLRIAGIRESERIQNEVFARIDLEKQKRVGRIIAVPSDAQINPE